ncbi:MAG: helix-turn-helix domain-containing protein [Alphaproteobacteria bacterium]|nr:helix-turn-helix domain-containing protein [Alphaproteobacteria bacterium]
MNGEAISTLPQAEPAGPWGKVAAAASYDLRLSASAVRVLTVLAHYADRDGRCFPSMETIARRIGVQRRVVFDHIHKLAACGHIRIIAQSRTRGGRGTNVYELVCLPVPAEVRRPPTRRTPGARRRLRSKVSAMPPDDVQPQCTSRAADDVQPQCTSRAADDVQPQCTSRCAVSQQCDVQFDDSAMCTAAAHELEPVELEPVELVHRHIRMIHRRA